MQDHMILDFGFHKLDQVTPPITYLPAHHSRHLPIGPGHDKAGCLTKAD